MRPVTINPDNEQAALVEIMRASQENDIVDIAQNFSFDASFTQVFRLLTATQPDSSTVLLLHFESDSGVPWSSGTWTPAVRFVTNGDLNVVYSSQVGFYQTFGQIVVIGFNVITSTFTWTAPSGTAGDFRVTGLPFPVTTSGVQRGPVAFGPITFGAGYTDIVSTADVADPGVITFRLSGAGVGIANANTTNFPSATNIDLRSSITYFSTALGTTSFTDSSSTSTTITTKGGVSRSTLQKEFGVSSALFDGTTGFLTFPSAASYTFQSAFTIDCWVRPTADAAVMEVFGKANGSNFSPVRISSNADGTWRLSASSAGAAYDLINNQTFGTLTTNTWQHLAIVWTGTTWYGFVNGVQGYTTASATAPNNTSDNLTIGARADRTAFFAGYMDEFRISTTARYSAAFTPSTIAYDEPTTANTAAVLATLIQIMQKGGLNRTT